MNGDRLNAGRLTGPRPQSWLFAGVNTFGGSTPAGPCTVLVQQGRIASVSPSSGSGPIARADLPEGCRVVDGAGRTLLPGFIDAHVHLGLMRPARVLAGGITACRDLGWPARTVFRLRDALRADPRSGPHLLAAGPMLTAPGGYPSRARWAPRGTAWEVGSAQEAEQAVESLLSQGAAVIKIAQEPRSGPCLSPGQLSAITGAAHRGGLRITSHLGSLDQLDRALDAGVDELAHGLWSNQAIPAPTIDRMVAAGMTVIPTLHIDPSPERVANLGRFLEAGGRVVYGTDMGNAGPPAGIDVAELSLLVQAGLTPRLAIEAATAGAAAYLGLEGRGRITPGAEADLVLVDGDPCTDLALLGRPALVLRQGQRVG